MRRILIALVALFLVATPVFALSTDEPMDSSPSADVVQKSDYTLVYPGILPDNPLYGIKMIRDKIILLLISDPIKKIKFNQIQADKRLMAGIMLWESDHAKLGDAIDTVSKGQNYFSSAVSDVTRLTSEGRDTSNSRNELITGARKHQEVLDDWAKEMPEKNKPLIRVLSARMSSFMLQVEGLK